MKKLKNKRPPKSTLVREGAIWWTKINDKWVQCIPYNVKEGILEESQAEAKMNNNQFKQLMNKMTSIEVRLDKIDTRLDGLESRMDNLESRMDNLESRMDNLENRIDELTYVVKKNHPNDFKN